MSGFDKQPAQELSPPAAESDAKLLEAIANSRCQKAFTELYRRYENSAYSVAYSLTANRALAEEAVQNGLLRVWLSAATFHSDNARGWIHCIIAHEGLKLLKSRRREQTRIMERAKEHGRTAEPAPPEDTEHLEELAALRNAVHRLPDLERQLMTLYFGVGLTQEEIARELDTPQQTISRRIKEALAGLRGNLAKAGFAAALPLVSAEGLSKITCSGFESPSGLQQKVMLKLLGQHAGAGASSLLRPAAKASRLGWTAGGAVATSIVVAAGLWWFGAKKPAAPTPPVQALAPAATLPAPAATLPAAAAQTVPAWKPVSDDFHEALGKGDGAWTATKTPNGLALAFAPRDGKDTTDPSYCYVGKNFTSSYEIKGVLEFNGQANDDDCGVGFMICHPNRLNCTGYVCGFKPNMCPMRFRMQVRFEDKGCRFAISVVNAVGQRRQSKPSDEWIARPWESRKGESWEQMAFAQMHECGFGFEVRGPLTFSQLHVRPLVDSEWERVVEDEK